VTLKGQVISKSGAMTGGHPQEHTLNRFQETEIQALNAQKTNLEAQRAQVESQLEQQAPQTIQSHDQQIRSLQAKVHYNTVDIQVVQSKIAEIHTQQTLRMEHMNGLQQQIDHVTLSMNVFKVQLADIEQQIKAVEMKVFIDFSANLHIENAINIENSNQQQISTLTSTVQKLSSQIASLASQLHYEQNKQYGNIINKLRGQLSNTDKDVKNSQTQMQNIQMTEAAIVQANASHKTELQVISNDKEVHMNLLKDLLARKQEIGAETSKMNKHVSNEEILLEKQRNQLHNLLHSAQLEQIPLPYRSNGGYEDREVGMEVEESAGAAGTEGSEEQTKTASLHFSDADNPVVIKYVIFCCDGFEIIFL
jgi:chromosome segregation ATPase